MYARLNMFALGPGTRSAAEQLVDQFAPLFKAQKGLKRGAFFGDDTVGEYASFSVWETKEDVEAANAALLPSYKRPYVKLASSSEGRQFRGSRRCTNRVCRTRLPACKLRPYY